MPKSFFTRIEKVLTASGEFTDPNNATGKTEINPRIKLVAALCVMPYGLSFHQVHELSEMSQSATRKTFPSCVDEIISKLGEHYLRVRRRTIYIELWLLTKPFASLGVLDRRTARNGSGKTA